MNAFGWRGVHALDAIALATARAPLQISLRRSFNGRAASSCCSCSIRRNTFRICRCRLKFQFLFSQLWYPLFSFFMALMFAMPVVALMRGENFVAVTYRRLSGTFCAAFTIVDVMAYRWRATGSFRPFDAKVLSWEAMFFLFARWPWALAGTIAAVRDWATGSFVDFRITPKGSSQVDPLHFGFLPRMAFCRSPPPAGTACRRCRRTVASTSSPSSTQFFTPSLLVIVVQHARENDSQGSQTTPLSSGDSGRPFSPSFCCRDSRLAERGAHGIGVARMGRGARESLLSSEYAAAGAGLAAALACGGSTFRPRWLSEEPITIN